MITLSRLELEALLAERNDRMVRLVGVLSEWHYARAHIPGSINITTVEHGLRTLRRDDDIVVYGSGWPCQDAAFAARHLERHGFKRVRVFEGGLREWMAADAPGEAGAANESAS